MKLIRLVIFPLTFFVLLGCKDKDDDNSVANLNREIYSTFQDIYLWYENLPQVNPENYATPESFVDALRYEPLDKWSFIMTKDDYNQYFVEGEMIGHGFILGSDEDNNVRIALIYPSTNAYNMGVRRGWQVYKVNNTLANPDNIIALLGESELGIRNTIEFINNNGSSVVLDLIKHEINLNPVVHSSIINYNNKNIGYIVFQDFIEVANQKIDSIFNIFSQEGIDELILDLRYNGGGSVDVALHLAGWLSGNADANAEFIKFIHNNKYTEMDTTLRIPSNPNSLDLENITFIGTRGTASASELMVIGVDPYMNVKLVGTPTDGKPVGMYSIPLRTASYMVFPISFKYTNAEDFGDFYDGLQPDILANDDVTRDFGDPNESMLNTALNSISGGIQTKKSTASMKLIKPDTKISEFQRAF